MHSPVAEILKKTEGRHFDSGLENEDGREKEVEYLQRKLQLLCVTPRITISLIIRTNTVGFSTVMQSRFEMWLRSSGRQMPNARRTQLSSNFKIRKQVCVEPPPSALNKTLPAFAAVRRRLQHGVRGAPAYLDMFHRQGAQRQIRQLPLLLSIRGTDGRTPVSYIDPTSESRKNIPNSEIPTSRNYTVCMDCSPLQPRSITAKP